MMTVLSRAEGGRLPGCWFRPGLVGHLEGGRLAVTTCCPHGDEKIHRHDTAARPDRGGGYPTDTGYISTYTTGTRTVGTRIG
ncbi:hypothetical protein ACWEPC_47620, partial [Nonomuraea sp. NPDC004297]